MQILIVMNNAGLDASGHMYSEDRPGPGGPMPNTLNIKYMWAKLNAKEYIRIGLKGKRPDVNQNEKGLISGSELGSRSSDLYDWFSEATIAWDGKRWDRTTSVGSNRIIPDINFVIGNNP